MTFSTVDCTVLVSSSFLDLIRFRAAHNFITNIQYVLLCQHPFVSQLRLGFLKMLSITGNHKNKPDFISCNVTTSTKLQKSISKSVVYTEDIYVS